MPLSDFCRMAKGKDEASQQITTDFSSISEKEFVELVWQNGQVVMQGQSSKKTPVCENFELLTPKIRSQDIVTDRMEKFRAVESVLDMPMPVRNMGLNQEDDIVPWLNYPVVNSPEPDYCSDFLPELSGVTVNEPPNQTIFGLADKGDDFKQTHSRPNKGPFLNQGNASKDSPWRNNNLLPFFLNPSQATAPSIHSGVSDFVGSINTRDYSTIIREDPVQTQKQESVPPCSSSSTVLNFSHFLRPAVAAKSQFRSNSTMENLGSSGSEKIVNNDKNCGSVHFEGTFHTTECRLQKEKGADGKSSFVPANLNLKPIETRPIEELRSCEPLESDRPANVANDSNMDKGLPEGNKMAEPIVASSVCSRNSADRASNDLKDGLKRKGRNPAEFECQSEDVEEESVRVKKPASGQGGKGSKQSRAAEVHNLSERRRRDRINEKMRALQELIPNCNKVDKASMLDEAIEYLKTLQLQVQIMSMGAGLCLPSMMFSTGVRSIHPGHLPHFPPMGFGMGFGMGMFDDNVGSQGRPMIPFPPVRGQNYPSPPIPGLGGFHGIPASTLPVFGHPGQGVPLLYPQATSLVPFSARPTVNPGAQLDALQTGAYREFPVAGPNLNSNGMVHNTGSQPLGNAEAHGSINQRPIQFQVTNVVADRSASVAKEKRGRDNGCKAAVLTDSDEYSAEQSP